MISEHGSFRLRRWLLGLVLLFPLALPGQAEPVMVGDIKVDPADFAPDKDTKTRIASCVACHGEHGGGDIDFGPDAAWGTPALRGLTHDYFKQSLVDYSAGTRQHKEMQQISALLDDDTIEFMATTFAAYPVPPLKSAEEIARLAEQDALFGKGQAVAQGVPEKGVAACAACHGVLGEGVGETGPRLAGQNAIYMRDQFRAYAEQARPSAQSPAKQSAATGLSADEIEAVAHYYEQLAQIGQP